MGEPWVPPRWTMPTFTGARLPAPGEEQADDRAGEQELSLDRDPGAVAAAAAVEQLLPDGTQPGRKVLEVGHRGGRAAEHGRIERATPRGEQAECDEAAADLEAPVRNVLVRYPVAGHVERRAEEQRERPRADEGSHCRAGCDVQRDDHMPIIAYGSSPVGLTDWFQRLFSREADEPPSEPAP